MKIKEVMRRKVVTIAKDESIEDAFQHLHNHKVSRLLVMDKGKLVGIVTLKDLLRVVGTKSRKAIRSPAHIHLNSAMSAPLYVLNEDQPIEQAVELMLEKGISGLPVLSGDKLTGLVTETDLLPRCIGSKLPVSEIMSREPITISTAQRVVQARKILLEKSISRLPVVEGGRFVGMVTERLLAEAMDSFKKFVPGKYQSARLEHLLIEDIMSQDLTSIPPDTTVGEAAQMLLEKKLSGVPVVDDDKLVGIVTKSDLLRALKS